MVKTLSFQCRGRGFDPWSGGRRIPHAVGHIQKKKEEKQKHKRKLNPKMRLSDMGKLIAISMAIRATENP